MVLGTIADLEVVKDSRAEIITYDPSHPDGLVWGTIAIQVIQLIGVEADEV
jgi:flagellar basal body rod protein FlgC